MLLDDNVVAQGEAEAGPLPGRLGGEKRIEHPIAHLRRNADPVVSDPDLNGVAEVSGRSGKRWFITRAVSLRFALRSGVETVGYQVQEHPGDFLREKIDFTRCGVQRLLQRDV